MEFELTYFKYKGHLVLTLLTGQPVHLVERCFWAVSWNLALSLRFLLRGCSCSCHHFIPEQRRWAVVASVREQGECDVEENWCSCHSLSSPLGGEVTPLQGSGEFVLTPWRPAPVCGRAQMLSSRRSTLPGASHPLATLGARHLETPGRKPAPPPRPGPSAAPSTPGGGGGTCFYKACCSHCPGGGGSITYAPRPERGWRGMNSSVEEAESLCWPSGKPKFRAGVKTCSESEQLLHFGSGFYRVGPSWLGKTGGSVLFQNQEATSMCSVHSTSPRTTWIIPNTANSAAPASASEAGCGPRAADHRLTYIHLCTLATWATSGPPSRKHGKRANTEKKEAPSPVAPTASPSTPEVRQSGRASWCLLLLRRLWSERDVSEDEKKIRSCFKDSFNMQNNL